MNVPPESTRSNGAEIIDVNVRPIVDGGFQEPSNSFSVKEPAKPGVEQPKKEQEMNVPLNDSLLVGHGGASASAPPPPLPRSEATSTVLYPIIDLAESEADETSHPTVSFTGLPTSSEEIRSDKDAVEQTLLRELEEMGFKQVDLNKEILRMNEYDLEQSVDDLCGVSEWDPILEELQEMVSSYVKTVMKCRNVLFSLCFIFPFLPLCIWISSKEGPTDIESPFGLCYRVSMTKKLTRGC